MGEWPRCEQDFALIEPKYPKCAGRPGLRRINEDEEVSEEGNRYSPRRRDGDNSVGSDGVCRAATPE
ncbi:hypothetical protein [Nocardia sp. GAS34]|uniref:hypothetical protein n=1 Tax=unclassified Nocardia TaxID=2637762 RepID=UPI003D22A822